MKKLILILLFVVSFFSITFIPNIGFSTQVNAQIDLCDLAPFLNDLQGIGISICSDGDIVTTQDTGSAANTVGQYIRFGLSLVFIGVIAFAVYTVIKAAIKYIQSEGDEAKVEEAQKAIKTVFIGIGALFVGIIGLIVIILFFGATGALGTEDTPDDSDTLDSFIDGLTGG